LSTREGAVSLFDYPRIHVFGTQRVNPGTGNNNSASPGEELSVTADSERVSAWTRGKSDAEFQHWITQLDQQGLLRCQWNYYGDMSFGFVDVRVRSVQLPDQLLVDPQHDALIGASVHLNNAVVCDVNPEGFNSTQIFAEALEIHAPGVLAGAGSFISRQPDRATTRWLNWQRNVSYQGAFGSAREAADEQLTSGAAGGASATFQCGIEVQPEDLASDFGERRNLERSRYKLLVETDASPGMSALIDALRSGARGLLFRYNLHLCYPRISDSELAQRFARGERTVNPAFGIVVGTIAPWLHDEPSTITLGRLLRPAAAFPNPYRKGARWYLSPAVARHDPHSKQLSIDLANCLPEDGSDADKYNLGTVTLGVRAATAANQDPATNAAQIHPLGTLRNDRDTYLDQGGIYDLSYAHLPDEVVRLDDGAFELVLETSLFGVLLYEPEFMLASDCTCSYLDELAPDQHWNDPAVRAALAQLPHAALRGEVDLWLLRRGRRAQQPVRVNVEEWRVTPTGDPTRYGLYRFPTLLSHQTLSLNSAHASFALQPSGGSGLRVFRFVPERQWPQDINERQLAHLAIQETFVELRILPYDDYSAVRDDELSFELIYREVLRYYHLITPGMSEALNLADPTIWQMPSAARYVLLTSSLELWASWQFMPRTRDLSRYRRELLRRFCGQVLQRHGQDA
jgi:hypothetical protein